MVRYKPKLMAKYNNIKVTADGYKFDSKAEYRFYQKVILPLKSSGVITDFEFHKKFPYDITYSVGNEKWTKKGYYECDFYYRENGEVKVIDVKGVRTKEFNRKEKIMKKLYGIEITVIGANTLK